MEELAKYTKSDKISQTEIGNSGSLKIELSDSVLKLTINRPEARNAMTLEVMELLSFGMDVAYTNSAVKVVVIQGEGEKAFCAGADLGGNSMMNSSGDSQMIFQHEAKGQLPKLFSKMWGLGKPIIAKVNGYAVAGGFGLALACDFLVASESAVFGATEVNVGLWPFMITVPILRCIPSKIALELMMTGRRIGAEEAHHLGFINRLCAQTELEDTLTSFLEPLLNAPPVAVNYGKKCFYAVENLDADKALLLLQSNLSVVSYSRDAAEGIQAFRDKRKPDFRGY